MEEMIYWTIVFSIVLISATFGLAHIGQGWKSAAGPAPAAVILGSLYEYTGSSRGDPAMTANKRLAHPVELSDDRLPTRL